MRAWFGSPKGDNKQRRTVSAGHQVHNTVLTVWRQTGSAAGLGRTSMQIKNRWQADFTSLYCQTV